jgi:hypothetical protein
MARVLAEKEVDKNKLAQRTNGDPASVGRWLDESTTIPAWFVGKFCETLGVDAGSLLGPVDGDKVELERRRALDETAALLRKLSEELKKGQVPTGLS